MTHKYIFDLWTFNYKVRHLNLDIAAAVQRQCDTVYRDQKVTKTNEFTVNTMMSNIYCSFCNNYIELVAAVYGLRRLLTSTPTVWQVQWFNFSFFFFEEKSRFLFSDTVNCDRFIFISVSFAWFGCEFGTNNTRNSTEIATNRRGIQVCGRWFRIQFGVLSISL